MENILDSIDSLSDQALNKVIKELILDVLRETNNPQSVFYAIEDIIEKLSEKSSFVVSFDLDFSSESMVDIVTTKDCPEDWSCQNIKSFLNMAFLQLSAISLIIFGINLKYNRPYVELKVGLDPKEKFAAIDLRSPIKIEDAIDDNTN